MIEPMFGSITTLIDVLLKLGAVGLVLNEIRGVVLAVPVLYGIYQAGGTWMAIWLGISSLGGIALSVIIPVIAARKVKKHMMRRAPAGATAT